MSRVALAWPRRNW